MLGAEIGIFNGGTNADITVNLGSKGIIVDFSRGAYLSINEEITVSALWIPSVTVVNPGVALVLL